MILSDRDIRKCLNAGTIRIDPPLSAGQIGACSVDLTLSNEFWRFRKKVKKIDLATAKHDEVLELVRADSITLKPGEMILGKTRERITLPADMCGRLDGRSRYARFGIAIHVSSSVVQAGSDNRQVLEIVNLSPASITLHAGLRVCQVLFMRISSPAEKPYAKFGDIARKQ
ncbi:MAG: dCTP deaminase [Candidatus Burarchaeum sp.]|nr:dCTP deaminase [Candidatus Burarchaeum sp.]MDO8339888.1 dCTP deaminase [Candidatus Burarchaeum sp.]